MSAKADKGDRKREIEQSPMKKKFRELAISSEDLDSAIASRIELAFKEHQSTLNSVVNSAVRDAMDSVLIPALRELREDILATNKSVKELREEFEAIVTKTKQTRDRVDSVQAAAREDKRTVTNLKDQLERLTEKMTDMEDRCRRNNVMLRSSPPRTLVLTSRQVVITTSGAFKSLWSEQDGDLTFLQKFNYFFNSTSIKWWMKNVHHCVFTFFCFFNLWRWCKLNNYIFYYNYTII